MVWWRCRESADHTVLFVPGEGVCPPLHWEWIDKGQSGHKVPLGSFYWVPEDGISLQHGLWRGKKGGWVQKTLLIITYTTEWRIGYRVAIKHIDNESYSCRIYCKKKLRMITGGCFGLDLGMLTLKYLQHFKQLFHLCGTVQPTKKGITYF